MLDPTDYKEPACALCGGAEFYNPDPDAPIGRVPTDRIINKLDAFLNRNDLSGAERHLDYWLGEAEALKDKRGKLSILNEFLGLYRKNNNKIKGLFTADIVEEMIEELGIANTVSGATILLNSATTRKAFGQSQRALTLYGAAKAVYDRDLSLTDARNAGLRNNRALAFTDLGLYEDAKNDYLAAVDILLKGDGDNNDVAITFVNLAHLYEATDDRDAALESMEKAKTYLETPKIAQNGYHAYVCTKCAPSFEYFGFKEYAQTLNKRAEELYARN